MVRKVSFWATKIKKVPVKVNFRTYDGKKVTFNATRAVRVPVKITFYKRRRK